MGTWGCAHCKYLPFLLRVFIQLLKGETMLTVQFYLDAATSLDDVSNLLHQKCLDALHRSSTESGITEETRFYWQQYKVLHQFREEFDDLRASYRKKAIDLAAM